MILSLRNYKILLIIPLVLVFPFSISAFDTQNCESIEKLDEICKNVPKETCEDFLKQCDVYLTEKTAQLEKDISKTANEKKTKQNQISTLSKEIKKLDSQIKQSNLAIKDVTLQVQDTELSIDKTTIEIGNSRERLVATLREINNENNRSLIEILIAEKDMSAFFDNLTAVETLNEKNKELLKDIKDLKTKLEKQKGDLDSEKSALERAVTMKTLQKQQSARTKQDQEYLLKLTEDQYQKQLKEQEDVKKKAAQIKQRIFEVIGVAKAPTFEEALSIARYVEGITGVRPAIILAVLTQESNIGKNVGQCYLTDTGSGAGTKVLTGNYVAKVMNPSRDVPYFLQIVQALGRNYSKTPVSCPMSVGWGGGMGPAQFIPDTWGNPRYGYGQKVSGIVGTASDPWDIKHAFLAAGLYLKDLGVQNNEFRAVMRYFSGNYWAKWEEFYGRSVLSIAKNYEADIKAISN